MTKEKLKIDYKVDADNLKFKMHPSKIAETCIIDKYCIYHYFKDNNYQVVLNGSVINYTVDLSKYI